MEARSPLLLCVGRRPVLWATGKNNRMLGWELNAEGED